MKRAAFWTAVVSLAAMAVVCLACGSDAADSVLSSGTASVSGTVTSSTGSPASGVIVEIGKNTTTSAEDGKYVLQGVPTGNRYLAAHRPDHSETYAETVPIAAPETIRDIKLHRPSLPTDGGVFDADF